MQTPLQIAVKPLMDMLGSNVHPLVWPGYLSTSISQDFLLFESLQRHCSSDHETCQALFPCQIFCTSCSFSLYPCARRSFTCRIICLFLIVPSTLYKILYSFPLPCHSPAPTQFYFAFLTLTITWQYMFSFLFIVCCPALECTLLEGRDLSILFTIIFPTYRTVLGT